MLLPLMLNLEQVVPPVPVPVSVPPGVDGALGVSHVPFTHRRPRQIAVHAEVTAPQVLILGVGLAQEPLPVTIAVFAVGEVSSVTVHGTGVGYDEGADVPMLMEVI